MPTYEVGEFRYGKNTDWRVTLPEGAVPVGTKSVEWSSGDFGHGFDHFVIALVPVADEGKESFIDRVVDGQMRRRVADEEDGDE